MKRPIEPGDIRVGDTIERHGSDVILTIRIARMAGELAWSSKDYCISLEVEADYFLLNRPTPAVELPTEPTLGWIEQADDARRRLGRFMVGEVQHEFEGPVVAAERGASGQQNINRHFRVTAFTPATAVPTEALDLLRESESRAMDVRPYDAEKKNTIRCEAINVFLDAVDEANEATA